MASNSVAVVALSTRTIRVGLKAAEFVQGVIEKPLGDAGYAVLLVDLVKFNLPVYNEAVVPAMVPEHAQFQFEHSKRWSAEIAKHEGYVLVIPEYNYGVAGGTKNAIDYLMNEWKGKPVVVVSYGVQGGKTASEQVKGFLTPMGLRVVETRPQLSFAPNPDPSAGPGPDVTAAMSQGVVGEETRKLWDGLKDEILKAAGELKDLLVQPNVPGNVPAN